MGQVTSGMSPSNNQSGPCLIVLAEWKVTPAPPDLTLSLSLSLSLTHTHKSIGPYEPVKAMAFRYKSLECFKVFPLRSGAVQEKDWPLPRRPRPVERFPLLACSESVCVRERKRERDRERERERETKREKDRYRGISCECV